MRSKARTIVLPMVDLTSDVTLVAVLLAIDSTMFYPLAFYNSGIMPNSLVVTLMFSQFITKTLVEIAFLPLTTRIVSALKRAENEDYFDRDTDFSPFRVQT